MLLSCSKDQPVYKATEKTNPYTLYNEGYDAFEINDFFNASKKFSEAEINFEKIDLAAKSAIMSCFSLYGINFYDEALDCIERFTNTYPSDKKLIYAEYLKAVIFFEQMSDEKKDIKPLLDASKQIEIFSKKETHTVDKIYYSTVNDQTSSANPPDLEMIGAATSFYLNTYVKKRPLNVIA